MKVGKVLFLLCFLLIFFLVQSINVFANSSDNYETRLKELEQKMQRHERILEELKLKERKIKELEAKSKEQENELQQKEKRIESLEDKSDKQTDVLSKASELIETSEFLSRLNPSIRFDGWLYHKENYDDEEGDETDAIIDDFEMYFKPKLSNWVSGYVEFEYGSHRHPKTEDIYLEECRMKIGNTKKFPVYTWFGKFEELPFGYLRSFGSSLPLTIYLQRYRHTDFRVGYKKNGFNAEFAVYNGDTDEIDSKHDKFNRYAGCINYHYKNDPLDINMRTSYTNNVADTLVRTTLARDEVDDFVPGFNVATKGSYGKWNFRAQYTTALEDFDEGEMKFGDGEARPQVWQLELGRWFDFGEKYDLGFGGLSLNFHKTFIYAGWHGTDEFCNSLNNKFRPEDRYLGGFHVKLCENAHWGIEYEENRSYSSSDGVSPNESSETERSIRTVFAYFWRQ